MYFKTLILGFLLIGSNVFADGYSSACNGSKITLDEFTKLGDLDVFEVIGYSLHLSVYSKWCDQDIVLYQKFVKSVEGNLVCPSDSPYGQSKALLFNEEELLPVKSRREFDAIVTPSDKSDFCSWLQERSTSLKGVDADTSEGVEAIRKVGFGAQIYLSAISKR